MLKKLSCRGRGRPTLLYRWWSELGDMQALVEAGMSRNAAAEEVVRKAGRVMATGSLHRSRSQASTVRMMKRLYGRRVALLDFYSRTLDGPLNALFKNKVPKRGVF
jgi:hypothetical protein